jgi:hypothetical protein
MQFWDPIGVADTPEAAGEYDGYLAMIESMLKNGHDEAQLATSLALVRTQSMGLGPNPQADDEAARRLVEWHRGAEPSEFDRFEALLKRLAQVPKKELDEKRNGDAG